MRFNYIQLLNLSNLTKVPTYLRTIFVHIFKYKLRLTVNNFIFIIPTCQNVQYLLILLHLTPAP